MQYTEGRQENYIQCKNILFLNFRLGRGALWSLKSLRYWMLSGVTENKTSQSEYSNLMLVWYLFQSRDVDLRDR